MLIPIGTEIEHKRQPFVTYWIIGLNLLLFALHWTTQRTGGSGADNEIIRLFTQIEAEAQLSSGHFHFWSLFTYQFLHAGWWHILGNMLFLLPFGKVIEDRMGHIGFALFYLGSGALGGLVHTLLYTSPVVGASGSVCAVVAAFIVLAPKTKIRVLLIFFIIGMYTIPGLLFVCFYVAFDTFSLLASIAGQNANPTAWVVHLIGYVSGFTITFSALALGLITSTEIDLTKLIKQSYRRRSLRKVIEAAPVLRKSNEDVLDTDFLLRTAIADAASTGDIIKASELYFQAIEENPNIKIDPRTLHFIGSSLIKTSNVQQGVQVFEQYLKQYKNAKDKGEVALLLAAKYARDLDNTSRANELLRKYKAEFSEQHQNLADTILSELKT